MEGGREGGRKGGRKGGKEGGEKGGREGGEKGGMEGGREERERHKDRVGGYLPTMYVLVHLSSLSFLSTHIQGWFCPPLNRPHPLHLRLSEQHSTNLCLPLLLPSPQRD